MADPYYNPERRKAYHEANREHENATSRENYRRNKEQRSLYAKERYLREKEKVIARVRAYEAGSNNLDPVKKKARQHRKNKAKKARRREAFVEHIEDYIVFELDEGICGICDAPILEDFHVDHIVPLSRGGKHSYANAQAAHPSCNIKKGAKLEGGSVGRAPGSQGNLLIA